MPEPKRQHPLGGYGGWSFLLPRRAYIPRRRLRQPTKQPLSRPTGPHPSSRRSQCGCRLSSRMACIATRSPLGSSEASTCSGGKLMMFRSEPAAASVRTRASRAVWRQSAVATSGSTPVDRGRTGTASCPEPATADAGWHCGVRGSLQRPMWFRSCRLRPASAHATPWRANGRASVQSNAGCGRSGARS